MDIDAIDNTQNNPAHRTNQSGNRPGKGKDPSHVNSQGEGSRLVIRHRSHINSLRGIFEEQSEDHKEDDADYKCGNINGWNIDVAHLDGQILGKKVWIVMQISTKDDEHDPLEHGGQSHRQHDNLDEGFSNQRT